jgi:hypothetical protein
VHGLLFIDGLRVQQVPVRIRECEAFIPAACLAGVSFAASASIRARPEY